MTVVVTGAAGFIGARLVATLAARVPAVRVHAVTRTTADLAEADAVETLLARLAPDRVVHLAGATTRAEDAAGRAAQWRDTFLAGRVLLERAAACGVRHVVVAGSVEELGDQGGVLGPELPARPRTTYGLCKALLREVAAFTARTASIRVDWVRPFTVYGPGQRGEMLVPYAFRAARTGDEAAFTDGRQERDFLYVDDLVAWFVLALGADASVAGLHVHHVGSGDGTPVRAVLAAIAEEFPGARFRLGVRPRREGEPDRQVAPRPEGAWRPAVGWREGVARTAAWWRTQEG